MNQFKPDMTGGCSCGTPRDESILVCERCKKEYLMSREALESLYFEFVCDFDKTLSKIKNNDLEALDKLASVYETLDPKVIKILDVLREKINGGIKNV